MSLDQSDPLLQEQPKLTPQALTSLGIPLPQDLIGADQISPARWQFETVGRPAFDARWDKRLTGSMFSFDDWKPVIASDLASVKEGGSAMSDLEALAGLRATMMGQEVAPSPAVKLGPGYNPATQFLGRVRSDAGVFFQAFNPMHFIPAMIKEPLKAAAVLFGGAQLGSPALERATTSQLIASMVPGHPLNQLQPGERLPTGALALAQAPILRFLPGWQTAGEAIAGPEGWKMMSEHPLLTLLDVLPYAKKFAAPPITAFLWDETNPSALVSPKLAGWALSKEALRSPFEVGGHAINAPWRTVLNAINEQVDGAEQAGVLATAKPVLSAALERISAEMGHPVVPSTQLTWGSLIERVGQYPFRKMGVGAELGDYVFRRIAQADDRIAAKVINETLGGPDFEKVALGSESVYNQLTGADTIAELLRDPHQAAEVLSGRAHLDELPEPLLHLQHAYEEKLAEPTALGIKQGFYTTINPDPIVDSLAQFGINVSAPNWLERKSEYLPRWEIYSTDAPTSRRYLRQVALGQKLVTQHDMLEFERQDLEQTKAALAQELQGGVVEDAASRASAIAKRTAALATDTEALQRQAEALARAWGAFTDYMGSHPPVRYYPAVRQAVEMRTGSKLENYMTEKQWLLENPASAPESAATAHERYVDFLDKLGPIVKDEMGNWAAYKMAGLDPAFVHQMSPGSLSSTGRIANVMPEHAYRPDAFMPNALELGRPFYHSLTMGLSDFVLQVTRRAEGIRLITDIMRGMAHNTEDFRNGLYDLERMRHPDWNWQQLSTEVETQMRRKVVSWDPTSQFPFTSSRAPNKILPGPKADEWGEYVISKRVMEALSQINRGEPLPVPAVYDKALKIWRTSLLALRPGWNIKMAVGGLMMLLARQPGALAYLRDGLRVFREADQYERLKLLPNPEIPTISYPDLFSGALGFDKVAARVGKVISQDVLNEGVSQGRFLGRMLHAIDSKVDWAYSIHSRIEQMYRTMAYLEGEHQAERAGAGAGSWIARERGLRAAQKVLQDWQTMSPLERNIFRRFVPFYGFMRHILRYTATYPWDHPLRSAILARVANIMIDQADPTLSDRFNYGMLKLGPLHGGNIRAIDIQSLNPMGDFARFTTLAGLLGYLNPGMLSFLEAMGVDTRTARADLYSGIAPEYDPQTGRMLARAPGLSSAAYEIFPQVSGTREWLANSEDVRKLKAQNPEAWRSIIANRFGVPFWPRGVDLEGERVKESTQRIKAEVAALASARAGNTLGLRAYYPDEQIQPLVDFSTLIRTAARAEGKAMPALDEILYAWRHGMAAQMAAAYGLSFGYGGVPTIAGSITSPRRRR